jgi:tetratricopeptide (TPR) repeat protein
VARRPGGKPPRRPSTTEASAGAAPAPAARQSSRRIWAAVTLAVIAIAVLYVAVSRVRQSTYAARLPALPDLTHQPSAMVTHLTDEDRAAHARPTSAAVVGGAGLAYHADMFYEQAQRCYEIAEALSGDWHWTYYSALASSARGDAEGLMLRLRRVVAQAPDFNAAWWQLGEAEFKAARYDEAQSAWRRVLTLDETRPTWDPALAGFLQQREQPPRDVPKRTIAAPIAAYAELGLARIALAQGDVEHAREGLEKLTERSPRFGPAYRLLGGVYASLNRSDDAKRAVRTADRLPNAPPPDPALDTLIAESRSSTFLLQQASTADLDTNAAWREYVVRRAVDFDPRNADALADLATMLRVLHRYDEALQVLERKRAVVGDDPQLLLEIGRCLIGLQRYRDAVPVLRRALDGLDDGNAHYLYGVVQDRLGQLPEAVAEFQRALERNPTHRDALNDLGVSLVRQGKLGPAAEVFRRLVATDPDNADAHTNLGAIYLAQGSNVLAEREFRAALEINPGHGRAREGLLKAR